MSKYKLLSNSNAIKIICGVRTTGVNVIGTGPSSRRVVVVVIQVIANQKARYKTLDRC